MFDISRLGQGPRPDLLVKDLEDRAKREKAEAEEAEKEKKDKWEVLFMKKAILSMILAVAMILALAELVFPWIAGGIAIYFAVVFLISRI